MRWGDRLEYVAEAAPGDFIYVPPYVPHQEINASSDETLECVLVRSDNGARLLNRFDVQVHHHSFVKMCIRDRLQTDPLPALHPRNQAP